MDAETTKTSIAETHTDQGSRRGELVAASILFLLASVQVLWFTVLPDLDSTGNVWSVSLLFIILVGAYLGLSVSDARERIRSLLGGPTRRLLIGPGILLVVALAYAATSGLAMGPRVTVYAAYLFAPPALILLCRGSSESASLWGLAAALLFWMPIEFDLLPSLPFPPPDGYDVSRVVAIVAAFYLFLVGWPLKGIGYSLSFGWSDLKLVGTAFVVYALVALPLGLTVGFLAWRPDVSIGGLLVTPVVIYLITALPEEFLFRGVMQNLLMRYCGSKRGLAIAAIIFGVAHLPDLRYVILATLAGFAYGWVYLRTGKITASALTHTSVNWVWVLLLSYP